MATRERCSPLSTLTLSDVQRFETDGYLVVREAFAPADALAMEDRWWAELASAHGIVRDDRASWRQIAGDLKAAKHDPTQHRILTPRVRGVLDDLLGRDAWSPPADWGRSIVSFPEPGDRPPPKRLWHWDSPCELHLDGPTGLFVVSFIGQVAPGGGGTLILSGSARLLLAWRLATGEVGRGDARSRAAFYRSHPWLRALAEPAMSPIDRLGAFMARETHVEGVPLRVVELTREPGDMVFCHPAMVHCAAPNRGERPRLVRIKQQLMTHEGRDRLRRLGAR